MKPLRHLFILLALLVLTFGGGTTASACSACFGKSNDKMLTAYYIGAMILVGFIVAVLGGISAFFVILARRAARVESEVHSVAPLSSTT